MAPCVRAFYRVTGRTQHDHTAIQIPLLSGVRVALSNWQQVSFLIFARFVSQPRTLLKGVTGADGYRSFRASKDREHDFSL